MADANPYRVAEDEIVRAGYADNKSDHEVSAELLAAGFIRTYSSVKRRRTALKLLRPRAARTRAFAANESDLSYWALQHAATTRFTAALRAAGAPEGVHTQPQTANPRLIVPPTVVRQAGAFVMPALDRMFG